MDVIEKLDEIDACVFTGDSLFNDDARESIKWHAERWLRAIKEHERKCPKCGSDDITFERSSGYAGYRCVCGDWFYM